MNGIQEAIAYFQGKEIEAIRTWTFADVLAHTIPHLEVILHAGDTAEEADIAIDRLQFCLRAANSCSQRDPSMTGVAKALQRLVWMIEVEGALKTPRVDAAFEDLTLEIQYCISSRE